MASYADIGLSQPAASTITMKVATVTLNRNSTVTHQEILTVGDAESSIGLMRVLAAPPASTEYGAVVRIASGPSSAADFTGRMNQGVGNSSAADRWNVISAPASTVWASSAGFHFDSSGALQVTGASASTVVTVARMVGNSSASDFMPVRIVDSSGTGFAAFGNDYTDGSTVSVFTAPGLTYNNGSNATMRLVGVSQPLPIQNIITQTRNSTRILVLIDSPGGSTTLVSSVASQKHKVYAYLVTSTVSAFSSVAFCSSATGKEKWGMTIGSGSSGITGANLAVPPPGSIFETNASEALLFSASSSGLYSVSIAYITEA